MVLDERQAGILLHPTSLPGRFGIGDLGPEAYRFLDWMAEAGLGVWQVLPLGPTGFGDSPYQAFSAFAGNPLLVSPEALVQSGLVTEEEAEPPQFALTTIDYGAVIPYKMGVLRAAHRRLRAGGFDDVRERLDAFCADAETAEWLEPYSLFMALKDAHGGRPWNEWPDPLRRYDAKALEAARREHAEASDFHQFAQFLFFDQWERLRGACREQDVCLVGDAPIYVAYDSADTWAHQHLFQLDDAGLPTEVAGVPPDYFSATGQLWGNPLYRWDRMAEEDYAWWAARIRSVLRLVDVVRLDHFRGFMGYWSVPFGSATAEHGQWVKGPGIELFRSLEQQLGALPLIAEDLGEITEDVTAVRRELGLPGMVIMQFAWSVSSGDPVIPSPDNHFLPHRHEVNSVVYTGTHDNDTSLGWWRESSQPAERSCMQYYLATDGNSANHDLMRAAFMSVANTAVVPAQDILDLGSAARMNYPGRAEGNWCWRLRVGQLTRHVADGVRSMTLLYERCHRPPEAARRSPPKQPPY